QGWTGLLAPEEYGGHGMGMVEMAVVLEEMGRALLPGPFFSTTLLAGTILARAGTEEQKNKYLKPIGEGDARPPLAEFGAYRRARWVPEAAAADFIVCAGPID